MQYAYAWYEIVGMCFLVGILLMAAWEGLNWVLNRLAERATRKALDELNRDGA